MSLVAGLACDCGSADLLSIVPGREAVYAQAMDLFGNEDTRLGSVMIQIPVPCRGICAPCFRRRYTPGDTKAA